MVIIVNPGDSIQGAVDNANPGDTVFVREGIYKERVVIGANLDRLRLIGEGHGETILDGSGGPPGSGITIQGSAQVTIAGFTARNFANEGILVRTTNNIIRDNLTTRNGRGIRIFGARNLVKGNTATNNTTHGILVDTGPHHFVVGNQAKGNGAVGIFVLGADRALVYGNEVYDNTGDGIFVNIATVGPMIIGNRTSRNGGDGIDINGNTNAFIYGNKSMGNAQAGLEIIGIACAIVANTLNNNKEDGVIIADSPEVSPGGLLSQSIFYSNTMNSNTEDGIQGSTSTTLNLFLRNQINNNGNSGLSLNGGDNNLVLFNYVEENNNVGINLNDQSLGNVVDDNDVEENRGNGILLDSLAAGNVVRSNVLEDNRPFEINALPGAISQNTLDLNKCERSSPEGVCS